MVSRIPSDAVSLADYERLAGERLSEGAGAYLDGASADGLTHAANLRAWERETIVPRVLAPPPAPADYGEMFGCRLRSPILVAPTAYHRLFHPEGELATAMGAAALDVPFVVSTQASASLEDIAGASGAGPRWFQLYLQHDRDFTRELIRRAERAGCRALVLTVDAPVHGIRNAEERSGFRLPPDVEAVNLKGLPPGPAAESPLDSGFLAALPRWEDVGWIREVSSLPLIVKGILHPDDARLAIEHGAQGVIVSNHGGRTLDQVPATADVLPAIAAAVDGRVPVLVDGGIRRGTHVWRALKLGADAVLVGRPVLHGLAVAGAAGVAHVLKLLHHEFEVACLLSGEVPGNRDFARADGSAAAPHVL